MATELRVVALGAPGAGKGTQAQRMAAAYGVAHVSTGNIFRAEVERHTDLGREVEKYLASGRLVPDDLTVRVLRQRLQQDDARGFVLDGFPRTRPQAEALTGLLEAMGRPLDLAVLLMVPDGVIVERLTARRVCPICGSIYNLRSEPPRRDEICDNVAQHGEVRLVQREDDTEQTVRNRLSVYHERTEPVIEYYREHGLLAAVDAAGAPPDEIFGRVEAVLANKGVVAPS